MKRTIRIGSRESKLAVAQTMIILNQIQACHPELKLELITMKTTGDRILDRTLDQIGGKGLFVKELDSALENGIIDLSVHSLKDMPMEQPTDLPILALSEREDPRDVLVAPLSASSRPFTEIVGTSSPRRKFQFLHQYPDAVCKPIRGNILTRLKKLDDGEYTSIILAASGLKRADLTDRISRYFTVSEMVPAAGQGILAIQGRKGEDVSFLDCIRSQNSTYAACAERSFVRSLDGDCSSPIAAYAQIEGSELLLTGFYCDTTGENRITGTISGPADQAAKLGKQLACKLKKEVS
jgi:hydroxymethylbilane synthase